MSQFFEWKLISSLKNLYGNAKAENSQGNFEEE